MSLTLLPGDWANDALCAQSDAEAWFPGGENEDGTGVAGGSKVYDVPRAICDMCPVRLACLEFAMTAENGLGRSMRHGMYGGLTPTDRVKLAQQRRETAA